MNTFQMKKELTPFEQIMLKIQIVEQKRLEKENNTKKFKWESHSVQIIKDQIEARKKLGLKNDWKIQFLESKLTHKDKLISKLAKIIQ